MASLSSVNWQAKMIAPLADRGQGTAASFVSTHFQLPEVAAGTLLHISAQGLYRCFINGERVGHDLLTPGWTCYDHRIAYQSYDVSKHLRAGSNTITIWLADGWWRSQLLWKDSPIFNCWGDRIGAIAQLEVLGSTVLATDQSWKSGTLPITKSGIYYGEDYDARLEALQEIAGVEVLPFKTALLVPHETQPVRELPMLAAVEHWTEADGSTVYDFGQNSAAVVRFSIQGEAGARVTIEHSEILGPNRFFDNRNYRSARAKAVYTLRGGEPETYQPHFTFFGFRYARVKIEGRATLITIHAVPISSVPDMAGGFTCGLAAVNRLVLNTVWSQRSNFIEVPTDCPQRDERLGWTGDANVFAGTACWLADSSSFLRKYLRDVVADQRRNGAIPHFSPDPTRLHPVKSSERPDELAGEGDWAGSTGWGDAIVTIPWQLYLHYGDVSALRECFPAMQKWLNFLWSISKGPIIHPPAHWGARGFTFGDWLQPIGDNRKPRPTIGDDCAATLYHAISTGIAARVAEVIGRQKEAAGLAKRHSQIKRAFEREYFSAAGRLAHNDQTSYALAFLYDLVPERHYEAAKSYFRKVIEDADGLIGTGFIGTPALLPALSKLGMNDLAEKVFLNRKVPGWLYQVERGATTIWERWDAQAPDGSIYDPDMNSYNHYAYGAVCQWLFESVAGIAPRAETPGFAEITIQPQFLAALAPVKAWHETKSGRVEVEWSLKGAEAHYRILLPDGCAGRLRPDPQFPVTAIDGRKVKVPAKGLRLKPGWHEITFKVKPQTPRRK